MTLYNYLQIHKIIFRLKRKFPSILEFSKRVRVIPWNKEFSIADRNPEKIKKLSELKNFFLKKAL